MNQPTIIFDFRKGTVSVAGNLNDKAAKELIATQRTVVSRSMAVTSTAS